MLKLSHNNKTLLIPIYLKILIFKYDKSSNENGIKRSLIINRH